MSVGKVVGGVMAESIRELEHLLVDLKSDDDPRRAAEVAYVIAVLCRDKDEKERAGSFAQESIRLFGLCSTKTMEESAPRYITLGGVSLPSFIHGGVVRARLGDCLEMEDLTPQAAQNPDERKIRDNNY